MNTQQIATNLQKAIGVDIDKLAEENPTSAHNMKEEFTALTNKVQEFRAKYTKN